MAAGLDGVAFPDRRSRPARPPAETDPYEACLALEAMLTPALPGPGSWMDDLAADLAGQTSFRLGAWAETRGLAPATVSRHFGRLFGVTPQRFRLQARTRQAWRQVRFGARSLTQIAYEAGFADLPHMSRSIGALTGETPSAWRAAHA